MLLYSWKQTSVNTCTHAHTGPCWLMDPKGTLSSPYPPCTIVMPHFSRHKRDGDEWFSQPFYSYPAGYKLCLRVDADDRGFSKGIHIAVCVVLMKGENDHRLQWPFEHYVTYGILNWKRDENHVICTLNFWTFSPRSKAIVTSAERASIGYGYPDLLSHASLYHSKDEHVQYLMEDCLCLQVLKLEPQK